MKLSSLLTVTVLGICCSFIFASQTDLKDGEELIDVENSKAFNDSITDASEQVSGLDSSANEASDSSSNKVPNSDSSLSVLPSSLPDSGFNCQEIVCVAVPIIIIGGMFLALIGFVISLMAGAIPTPPAYLIIRDHHFRQT